MIKHQTYISIPLESIKAVPVVIFDIFILLSKLQLVTLFNLGYYQI